MPFLSIPCIILLKCSGEVWSTKSFNLLTTLAISLNGSFQEKHIRRTSCFLPLSDFRPFLLRQCKGNNEKPRTKKYLQGLECEVLCWECVCAVCVCEMFVWLLVHVSTNFYDRIMANNIRSVCCVFLGKIGILSTSVVQWSVFFVLFFLGLILPRSVWRSRSIYSVLSV